MSDPAYFHAEDCQLEDLKTLCAQNTDPGDVPHAAEVIRNIPIYDVPALEGKLQSPEVMAEWARVLRTGAGALVLRTAYSDTAPIDAATLAYDQIIAAEKAESGAKADHFAAKGNNDRVWNSLQKLCAHDPEVFARYFGNVAVSAVCEAWLGPNYQMSAQVNLVRPGGAAQEAHRDYHLGFQTAEISARYPAHVHDLSPVLTLQGGIAHTDMPLESGPTKLLPFSQAYRAGYAAWRLPEFRAYFEDNYVQLPLKKGDVVFFNPAIFHGAGANTSEDIQRMANLIQISSAFGRAMETIDRSSMCLQLFPVLKSAAASGGLAEKEIAAAIAAIAEGYSFPTNLDNDPPIGGLAPVTQNQLFHKALTEDWEFARFEEELMALTNRQRS